jgi:hypothetical protein
MDDCRGRKATMNRDTPEIRNLFTGDPVVILDEKWEGEEPFRRKKFEVRSLRRVRVEGWVNESDVSVSDEKLW